MNPSIKVTELLIKNKSCD